MLWIDPKDEPAYNIEPSPRQFECIMPTLTLEAPKPTPPGDSRVVVTNRPRLWTVYLKMMGNLIPALVATPFAVYGIWWMSTTSQISGRGFWIFAMAPPLGWLAMNYFGLHQNKRLRKELLNRLSSSKGLGRNKRYFVGIATPRFTSLLDPHEDVGFLILHEDRLEFYGDRMNLSIDKSEVSGLEYRANAHSLLGLGRWISIEGRVVDSPIRLQVEPRERQTLLGNLAFGRTLKREIAEWAKEKEPRSPGARL
jgi:hypothetical protein